MTCKKALLLVCICLTGYLSNAQIQVSHFSVKTPEGKKYAKNIFSGFLGFSVPAGESDYVTLEGGVYYMEDVFAIPVSLGYRYTLNRSGRGFYAEPFAGYNLGSTDLRRYNNGTGYVYDANGKLFVESIKGPSAGGCFGFLFEPWGNVQFDLGLRYEHTFSPSPVNIFSFRISHQISIGRRD
jgi:hypothetical protein